MEKFASMSEINRKKVYFIHFNHTNPLLNSDSEQSLIVEKAGFNIAKYDMVVEL